MKTILLIDDSVMLRMTFGNACARRDIKSSRPIRESKASLWRDSIYPTSFLATFKCQVVTVQRFSAISGMILNFGPARSCS